MIDVILGAITGLAAVVSFISVGIYLDNRRVLRGNRRTRAHNYSRAGNRARTIAEPTELAAALRALQGAGEAAGDASDPRAGEGPGLTDDFKVPDAIEAIEGHRAWRYNRGYLCSVNDGIIWSPKEALVAECEGSHHTRELPQGHTSPEEGCSCGIYAAKEPSNKQFPATSRDNVLVWGTVSMWGKVIVYSLGWRAQYAYPKELFVYSGDAKRAEKAARDLARRYCVPVRALSEKEAIEAGAHVRSAPPARVHSLGTQSGIWAVPSGTTISTNQPGNSGVINYHAGPGAPPPQPMPIPQHNPNFQSFASYTAYQEYIAKEAKMALAKAKRDALERSVKAAQNLIDMGMVLPESLAAELSHEGEMPVLPGAFEQEFPSTPEEAQKAIEANPALKPTLHITPIQEAAKVIAEREKPEELIQRLSAKLKGEPEK